MFPTLSELAKVEPHKNVMSFTYMFEMDDPD